MTPIDRLLDANTTPAEFVESLQDYALRSRAANHELLERIAQGAYPNLAATIERFLSEYYHYSHQFTRYLTATMANLTEPEHRAALVRNATDEVGHVTPDEAAELLRNGINPEHARAPHPELFRRFLRAIGVKPEEVLRRGPSAPTLAWIESFRDLCHYGGEHQAVGALGVATEGIVAIMYRRILRGIHAAWPHLTQADTIFFDLHAVVDDDHADTLRHISETLATTPEGRKKLLVGVMRSLSARAAFFDEMMADLDALASTHTRTTQRPIATSQGAFV